jgi:hypothetical protein
LTVNYRGRREFTGTIEWINHQEVSGGSGVVLADSSDTTGTPGNTRQTFQKYRFDAARRPSPAIGRA